MHDTAYEIGRRFLEAYAGQSSTVVDLGACNVNGTLRDVCPEGTRYFGLDVAAGPGVDVVVKSSAPLPLASDSVEIVVSSSMFEHDMFFWQTFMEMVRITKPGGAIYINTPSNGWYHRYPVDNWRFYPDCGKALESWAVSNGIDLVLIESFVAERMGDVWNDFVAVFRKGSRSAGKPPVKFISDSIPCTNAWRLDEAKVQIERESSEDMVLIQRLRGEIAQLRGELSPFDRMQSEIAQKIFWLEASLAQRETEIRALETTLAVLYASTSWKISAPLRWAKRWFGNTARPGRCREFHLRKPVVEPMNRGGEGGVIAANYSAWQCSRLSQRLGAGNAASGLWNHLITIVIFAAEPDTGMGLPVTLDSLRRQSYRNIELLIAGGSNDLPADLADFSGHRGLFLEAALHPLDVLTSPATDRLWRGSYLMFARAGTQFDPDAFALLNAALNPARGDAAPDLVLCDHDRLTASGEVTAPSLGPGWDPDLICAFDYMETAFLASRALVLAQRAAQPPTSLHQWLRGIARGLRQPLTGHVAEPLVHMPESAPRPVLGHAAPALPWTDAGAELPALAIIIPNRNKPELLKRCVSFLEFPNRFRPELVVVDNASDDPAVRAIYRDLCARHGARIVQMDQPFNFSRMVNLGVAATTAEVVLLLNNDVEVTAPGLLEQILAHALRPEVGVVGSRLLYPDGTVQHTGMILRPGPTREHRVRAEHVLRGAPRTADGYLHQLRTVRNYQCVTGALQAMRREVFRHVGGFDEVSLPVEFGDVDFCLRVRRAGWRVIALPIDGVIHGESATRGIDSPPAVVEMRTAAMAVIAERWPDAIAHDPYRNPWVDIGETPETRFPWSAGAAP
jgi:GT2 family glycosyltransferase/SAM-dependent methyltransferase